MVDRKKILILHASAGHGHEKAAKAVLAACSPNVDTKLYDVLDLTPPTFGKGYRGTYIFLIKSLPWLWGFLYESSDWPWLYFFLKPLRRLHNAVIAAGVANVILKEKPDVLIATHFMPVEVGAALKRRKKFAGKLISVITDYRPHSFWLENEVDVYAVGMPGTQKALEKRGVPPNKIRVTGIPIDAKFALRRDQADLFPEDKIAKPFTVLLTSGGAGVGSTGEIVRMLPALGPRVRALVVCGTNRRLYDDLMPKASAALKVYGFVNNMDELMRAADVIVGKGGGLTIAESMASERPVILFEPVPGQETRNASALEEHGAGIWAHSLDDVIKSVRLLLEYPGKLEALKSAINVIRRPEAAREIARIAERG